MQKTHEPILVGKVEAAALCSLSRATWDRYRNCGWVPEPVRIGNALRWNVAELRDWISKGCPRH